MGRTAFVATILAGLAGSAAAQTTPDMPAPVLFAPEQETILYRHVIENSDARRVSGISLDEGATAPEDVELSTFPADVYKHVPTARSHRYVRTTQGLAMIDPMSRKVVRIIENR